MYPVRFIQNTVSKADFDFPYLSGPAGANALRYLKTIPEYQPTPLTFLPELAKKCGVASIAVKDESQRFGLGAFKALGGAYAIGVCLAERAGIPQNTMDFPSIRHSTKEVITFATATDGNHGQGIAWAARKFGQNAVVFMPRSAEPFRVEAIRSMGVECTVTDLSYDETVAHVFATAKQKGWVVMQDTAFDDYSLMPAWIMQGYCAMGVEILEQLAADGKEMPTHVFLQAGVGSFAAALFGYFKNTLGRKCPSAVIVEPHIANCLFASASNSQKSLTRVPSNQPTIMAVLDCGTPSTLAWDILRDHAGHFVTCPEYLAANGMRILAAPLGNDVPICSGQSGAVGAGLLEYTTCQAEGAALRKSLKLNASSRVLLFSTEGKTDPETYRDIVWKGAYPQ